MDRSVPSTRELAMKLDLADELARWREQFVIRDPELVYLDGNSLGRTPKRTLERMREVLTEEWGSGLIRSWARWLDMPQRVGDRLAPLLGARPGEVVVHDSTSINLYQLVHGALAMREERGAGRRRGIAVAENEFPSDRYVVDGIAEATGCTVHHGFDRLEEAAVVVRSLVDYRTSEVADLAVETARARAAGAMVVWDLSHAAGVLEIDLAAAGVELAVGCTYKYLNGGPGAPAFSYVATEIQGAIRQPIQGWFGQEEQFAMGPAYRPRVGITRLLVGTPSILALTAAEAGIELAAEAGIGAIAAKAAALTAYGMDLCDRFGLATATPREAHRRGGHVAVVHPEARALTAALARRKVIVDFREPDIVRFGMSPLTTRFIDVCEGLTVLAELAAGR
ncbi:MAG: aminotransferase class V-fold PLP-dependent enzyme [Thermoanaerobaculia bacterium]